MESERSKTKILIFGGTGYIGKYMVNASLLLGHPTFVYSRPVGTVNSSKIDLLNDFHSKGVTVVHGEIDEQEKIISLLKQVDVVISTLPYPQVLQQFKIIDAIKLAGNIKRFFPSDFGCEEDKIRPLPPFQRFLDKKIQIRRATEASGIPYTFVSANLCAAYFVNHLLHPHDAQLNEIHVYGTGLAKAVLNYEEDIAMYTIKAANDPRTRNRIIIYRPPENVISQLELISLWETKTGRSFNKVFVTEAEIVKLSQTLPHPQNIPVSILHSMFIRGDTTCFEIGNDYVEASQLYPDVKLTSIHHLLDIFLVNRIKPAIAAFE